jgi:BirA family biotin operon repressor/biotin-[acetyl-CoA-carboxylase] ligase
VEERAGCVLAGIGVNLAYAPGPELLREDFKVPAGEFHPCNGVLGPLGLWRSLVNRLETGYTSLLEAFSPSEFLTIFRSRLAWQGRRVLVREGASLQYEAVVRGISEEGGLVLDHAGREVVLLAGDVIPV